MILFYNNRRSGISTSKRMSEVLQPSESKSSACAVKDKVRGFSRFLQRPPEYEMHQELLLPKCSNVSISNASACYRY